MSGEEDLPQTLPITFRLYEPTLEELKLRNYHVDPIDVHPREALNRVETIIQQAVDDAPDLDNTTITLAPTRNDADLKRIMAPEVDELIQDTVSALRQIRKQARNK